MERKLRQRLTDEELQRFEGYTASIFVRVGMDLNTLVRVKLRADGSRPFGI